MATPQVPFISAPFKKTDDIDWVHPLKKYIARFYQDDPEKYKEETQSFNRLRQDIRGAGKDFTGRDLLYRYFGQLELLDLRFPVDEKHVKVLFNWYDAFSNRAISQYSLAFEKASIIFNEAATLSAIASSQNRAEADGRKKAFHYFQASAGMFQYINDNFLHAPSEDLSRETVNMLSELMLAQAQECFLESSIREKSKDGLIAKLASHAAWVYGNLIDSLGDAVNRSVGIDKSWTVLCQVKQKYYCALAQEHKAATCLAEAKYGECAGRYAAAESAAKEAAKLANNLHSALVSSNHANGTISSEGSNAIQELCKNMSANCAEKSSTANRDNDLIYHDSVPQECILTPIDRLKAVKAIPIAELYGPDEMKRVIGADIFSKLIPISVHESASLYSEEIAKLLRSENERCDIAKAELIASLDYMKLPGSLAKFKQQRQMNSSLDDYASPPSDVKSWADQIAAEERRLPVPELWNTLNSLKTKARQTLDEASLNLDKEMRDCEQGRVQYAELWTQAPSGPLTTEFRHDISNHRRTLDGASQSDNQLMGKYDSVRRNIDILKHGGQSRELEGAYAECISTLANGSTAKKDAGVNLLDVDTGSSQAEKKNGNLNEKVQRIEAIIDKLRKIESDREGTFRDLKDKTMQDDISQLLILNKKANVEQHIFASELEKYRPHQQRISATIQHQQQTIQDLTFAFKDLMEGEEAQNLQSQHDKADRLCRNLTADFNEARSVYNGIKDDLNRGIQFYSGLQETLDSLQRNIQRFVSERSNERSRLMDSVESTKSSREQELLRETLNKYTVAPPPPAPSSSSMSSASISHLTNQTRQMSISEPTAPTSSGYTPAPPPKPAAFVQQQQQQQYHQAPPTPINPSPFGTYGSNIPSTTYHQPPQQPPYAPVPQSPMQHAPYPMFKQQPYQPASANYPSQQQPQGYYGNMQAPPLPPQSQYHHQISPQQPQYTPPTPQIQQQQQQPHQGYQSQYQPHQQWQQQPPPHQQQPIYQQPLYQQQQFPPQQQPQPQRPPPPGNLLD
ncbi:BRO1-like domain-containing protein [Parasitella parasitica]|nr:BRO1-like domain-containing protein [Parasitella parasitica]